MRFHAVTGIAQRLGNGGQGIRCNTPKPRIGREPRLFNVTPGMVVVPVLGLSG